MPRQEEDGEGFQFTLATIDHVRYILTGKMSKHRKLNAAERDWLQITSAYVTIKLENLKQIEHMLERLKRSETEQQEEEKWVEKLFFKWAEKERRNLAFDLHDTILQEMVLHRRHLEYHRKQIGLEHPEMEESVRMLESNVEDMISSTRETFQDMKPPELQEKGLRSLLEEFVQKKNCPLFFRYSVDISN